MNQTPLKVAVVGGSGLIGKRHCQHIVDNPHTQLVAIVDPSPAAESVAGKHGTALYLTVNALLASPQRPDAAIVCTPNHAHVSVSLELAQAGIHILCEKPLSVDLDSARQLINEAQKHDIKLLVGHHRRFNPYILAAKRIVDSGALGQVTAMSGIWTTAKPPQYFEGDAVGWRSSKSKGGGPIMINFVHEIDLMHYLFGPLTRIHAEKTVPRRKPQHADSAEEGVAMTMRFESGIVGTFIISDNVSSPHSFEQGTGENPNLPKTGLDVYRIFGTEGTLSFPDMLLSTYDHGPISWETQMNSRKLPVENIYAAPLDSQLTHFVRVCRGEEQPSCTGEDGLRALEICEAVRQAIEGEDGGGTVLVNQKATYHQ